MRKKEEGAAPARKDEEEGAAPERNEEVGAAPARKEEEGAALARDARSTSLLPSRSRFEIHRSWKSGKEAASALHPCGRAHGLRGPRCPLPRKKEVVQATRRAVAMR